MSEKWLFIIGDLMCTLFWIIAAITNDAPTRSQYIAACTMAAFFSLTTALAYCINTPLPQQGGKE